MKINSQKSINSAVVVYLVDSSHVVNPLERFKVIYRGPVNLPKSVQLKHIPTAEAVAIPLRNPVLFHHKRFIQSLRLLWTTRDGRSGGATSHLIGPNTIPSHPLFILILPSNPYTNFISCLIVYFLYITTGFVLTCEKISRKRYVSHSHFLSN